MAVQPIPEGFNTVTPYLVVSDAAGLIAFLEKAFDATVTEKMAMPDGTVAHAQLKIGSSMVMMGSSGDCNPALPCMLYLYVEDADALYKQAVAAGAKSVMEPTNMFYGDRNAAVADPAGNQWWIGTHVEDVAPEELARRAAAAAQEEH